MERTCGWAGSKAIDVEWLLRALKVLPLEVRKLSGEGSGTSKESEILFWREKIKENLESDMTTACIEYERMVSETHNEIDRLNYEKSRDKSLMRAFQKAVEEYVSFPEKVRPFTEKAYWFIGEKMYKERLSFQLSMEAI